MNGEHHFFGHRAQLLLGLDFVRSPQRGISAPRRQLLPYNCLTTPKIAPNILILDLPRSPSSTPNGLINERILFLWHSLALMGDASGSLVDN